MLEIKRRPVEDPGSSGSLNDLSFLLIIFFIVIAGFNVNKGFLLNLPEKSKPRIVMTQDLMKCMLKNDGTILIDGKKIREDELERRIQRMQKSFPNMTFLLEVEGNVPYQRVIDVISFVRKNQVGNFSFRLAEENKK